MAQVDTTTPARPPARRDDDWAIQTADTIDRIVETVRSNTSDRLVSITRGVVFGLLALILATTALVVVSIVVVRVLVILLGSAWAAYLVLGGLFTLFGLLLWRQAWKRPESR
jgi:hypothetical protein